MSKERMQKWAKNLVKTGIQAFAGAIAVGFGGGAVAEQIGHPIDWQAQLVVAGTAAVVAVAGYLQEKPLWD